MKAPANLSEYKAAVKAVAEKVSDKLGNEPAEAIKSYIDPTAWGRWSDFAAKKTRRARDWWRWFTGEDAAQRTDQEIMDEHFACNEYVGERGDWRAAGPGDDGDDDDGGEEDDIDQLIEEMCGGDDPGTDPTTEI